MLQLLAAELFQLGAKRRFVVAESADLVGIMLVDGLLDGDGAGHGRALAHQCGGGAQREAGDVPDRPQRRPPHPARNSGVWGKSVSVRLALGGAGCYKKKKK